MINFADVFGVKYPLRLIIDGIKRSMIKKNRKDQILMKTENEDISMLAEIDTNPVEVTKEELDQVFPVMTLRNLIMFPSVVMPVTVGRQSTLKLVNTALKKKSSIVITTQKVSEVEAPGFKDLYPVAVIGKVLRIFEMPGGNTTVILQSNGPKVNLDEITATRPYLQGKVSLIEEDMQVEKSDEMKALMDTCRELSTKYVEASERMSPDTAFAIKNLDEPEILVNFICTNFPFSQEDRYALLCINNLKDRLYRLIQVLNKEVQLATLKQNIQMRTREDLDRQQREYFLQQQIKNIQDELGNGQNDEVEELREKQTGTDQPAVSGLQRAADLPSDSAGTSVGCLYGRCHQHTQCRKGAEQRPLWPGKGKRTYSGTPGCIETEERPEISDHLPVWSSGSRKNFSGTFHCCGPETEIRPNVTGRCTR